VAGVVLGIEDAAGAGVDRRNSTWYDDGLDSLVIALDESSQGPVEDGTKVQQPRLEAVRRQNVGKVEITYRDTALTHPQ